MAAAKTTKPDKQVNNRTKKGTFKKGVSGNPSGRQPKEFALNEHIRSIANQPMGKTKKTILEAVVRKFTKKH